MLPWVPPPPVEFELGNALSDNAFRMCIRMTKKGAAVWPRAAIQPLGVPSWSLFGNFLLNNAVLENVCFTKVKHTFSLN